MRTPEERKARAVELQKKYNLTARQAEELTGNSRHQWKHWLYEHKFLCPTETALRKLEIALGEG